MKVLAGTLSLLLLAACGGGDDDVEREISFTRLSAEFPGAMPSGTYEFRNQAQVNEAWRRFEQYPVPIPSAAPRAPSFDFSAYMVVGISFGWAPTPCQTVSITSIRGTAAQIVVEYVIGTIPPGAACSTVIVPSLDFARIPTNQANIVFRQRGA